MQMKEFKKALYEQYEPPKTRYEEDMFLEWATSINDSGGSFKNIFYEILQNYTYSKFPAYKVYSQYFTVGSKLGRKEYALNKYIQTTRDMSAREIYIKCKKIFEQQDTTPIEREFFLTWGDLFSITGFMIDKDFNKEVIASNCDLLKKWVVDGRQHSEMYAELIGAFEPVDVAGPNITNMRYGAK